LAQISLLYALSRGDHVSVLVGADRTQHLDEMSEIRNWTLDKEAIDCLTAASMDPRIVEKVSNEIKLWNVDEAESSGPEFYNDGFDSSLQEAVFS